VTDARFLETGSGPFAELLGFRVMAVGQEAIIVEADPRDVVVHRPLSVRRPEGRGGGRRDRAGESG
jgi:hypothetical protein